MTDKPSLIEFLEQQRTYHVHVEMESPSITGAAIMQRRKVALVPIHKSRRDRRYEDETAAMQEACRVIDWIGEGIGRENYVHHRRVSSLEQEYDGGPSTLDEHTFRILYTDRLPDATAAIVYEDPTGETRGVTTSVRNILETRVEIAYKVVPPRREGPPNLGNFKK